MRIALDRIAANDRNGRIMFEPAQSAHYVLAGSRGQYAAIMRP